jgi:hypothetical protein
VALLCVLLQVLTWIYQDDCWFMESIDLLRKYLLTGVIQIVLPRKQGQLLYGTLVCLLSLAYHLRVRPYSDPECDLLQGILMVQLLITYVAGGIMFAAGPQEISSADDAAEGDWTGGLFLVCANSMGFIFMLRSFMRGVGRLRADMSHTRLSWTSGSTVRLEPPRAEYGFHVFLSHEVFAETEVAFLKSTLTSLVPTSSVFLHADDMKDAAKLETHVQESDVFVAFVTNKYPDHRSHSARSSTLHAVPTDRAH